LKFFVVFFGEFYGFGLVFEQVQHNVSITLEQQLFRQIENARGREKRSTFIEHLIIQGLKTYTQNPETPKQPTPIIIFPTQKRGTG
jgi:metal-responsive CopG/Arc/MetJ family transcriptional regulator